MKRGITKILAIVLAIIVGITTLPISEKVMAAGNVTINFEDKTLYELILKKFNNERNYKR